MPELYLKTIDNLNIFANFHPSPQLPASGPLRSALFLHQRGKDHTIWNDFRNILEAKGFSTLAIDLRGHGRSEGFGKSKDLRFDQYEDYHSMYFDVTAAMNFLKSECTRYALLVTRYAIVGSSIGANLSLAYAADHFDVNAAVCLSPGLNYYGLRTDDVMVEYHRPLAIITAKDDPSYPDAQKLIKEPGVQRPTMWYQEYDTGGHGVALLQTHPELAEKIAEWMEKQIV